MHLPITKPFITQEEFNLIQKPLQSGWLVQGPMVKEFEKKIADYTGAKYAVAVNSCTSGQFIMSRIIGLEPGDEVVIPAFTWISTANAAEFLGAKAVFCDIELDTFNIDVQDMEQRINERTKAIFPVTLFGLPPDLPFIKDVANRYNLKIAEDCACGLGGKIKNQHCGLFGVGGVLSFHPRKSITTGEGGMIITNSEEVFKKARSLREHGAVKSDYERHTGIKSFELTEYPDLGYNMRLTDLQAAMGVAQANKIETIFSRKKQLAKEFDQRIGKMSWLAYPKVPGGYSHGYQAYCTLFKPDETLKAVANRDQSTIDRLHTERNVVMEFLEKRGISTRPGTHAVHIQDYYRNKYPLHPMDFPNAYAADRLTIALPFFPTMKEEEVNYLFKILEEVKI